MSIRPVTFQPNGDIDVVHDELGHGGTIPAAEIIWTNDIDGNPNHNFIVLNCPDNCGSSSTHPVGGGADAPNVQQMFVEKVKIAGCSCGQIEPNDTSSAPESHVRLNCNRMDGPGRWKLDSSPGNIELYLAGILPIENSPKMFQVVYREADNLIVGLEPNGGVGPNNKVAVIHDMNEYNILMQTDPAYLSADGDHIVASPPA